MNRRNQDIKNALANDLGWLAGNVLDIRSPEAFSTGHLRGAANLPAGVACDLAPGKLAEKLRHELPSIFLPPREEALLVLGDDGEFTALVAGELGGRGRAEVSSLVVTPEQIAALPAGYRERGSSDHPLWSPPAWLEAHSDLLPPPAAGPVLDLACGSGRAVVWLAERGYHTTGIDWQPEALELGRRLAVSRGVACRFLPGDLRRPETLPAGPWSVVLNFRFLQRDLLARLPALLRPGGVAMIRTFRDVPGYQGHPAPRHRLQRSELPGFFPAGQFTVLAHAENHDPDGRPAAGIVVRRLA